MRTGVVVTRLGAAYTRPCLSRFTSPSTSIMLIRCFHKARFTTAAKAVTTQAEAAVQSSKVQQLYQQAHDTFGDGKQPRTPVDLQAVNQALRDIPLQELGMQAPCDSHSTPSRGNLFDAFQRKTRPPSITYIHIYEDQTMSIGMFCLPRNATIPLHNHPGMVVLSRVLYGQLHVKSYDWTDAQQSHTSRRGRKPSAAKLVLDEVVEPSHEPAVIFPTAGGNIHQFTAVTDCAVLDILAPPYSPTGGRDCTYYKAIEGEEHGMVLLTESNPMPPLNMQNKTYTGTRIQPAE